MLQPTFGSLFSGIGGLDLGLEWAGWSCRWQVEIDDWRRKVLERHWPDIPKWADVRDFARNLPNSFSQRGRDVNSDSAAVDLICGGFPCQDVSVAGKRAGLAGKRSGLFFEFARVVSLLTPRWVLVENVPGLLSSHEGDDIGEVLATFSELGYGLAWRVLDSQYFGVPQRCRRVFIVGHLGAPCPPEILFEPEGGGGNPQTGGKAGETVANPLGASTSSFGGQRYDLDNETYVAQPLRANRWGGSDSHGDEGNVVAYTPYHDEHAGRGAAWREGARLPALRGQHGHDNPMLCAPADPDGVREATEPTGWLDACSRCPDGRRYAALGDAVTAVVAGWIGSRILKYGY